MRILLVNTLYPPSNVGGAEKSTQLLADGLASRGHDVAVACVANQPAPTVCPAGAVIVYRFPLRNRHWPYGQDDQPSAPQRFLWHARDQYNPAATTDLTGVIDDFRPDVINTNNLVGFSTEIWKTASERDIRVVHTLRDYSLMCSRGTLFRGGENCERRCAACWSLSLRKRANHGHVDHVVSVGQAVLDRHREFGYFKDTPGDVIFNIASTRAIEAPAELTGDVTFGFVGRLEPEKGIEVLLEAVSLLGDRNWRLRVAGSGDADYVAELKRRFRHSQVDWLGHVDADDFYASIDVLAITAVWPEPMGRIAVEAAVRGVSVIHTDAGGLPEVAAFAAQRTEVQAGNVTELQQALQAVLDAPASWRTRTFDDTIDLDTFSVDRVVDQNEQVFSSRSTD